MQTKIISFMTQKGGAGKSTITNSVILNLLMRELLKKKQAPRILLVDVDKQASSYNLRREETDILACCDNTEGKEFLALDESTRAAFLEIRKQYFALSEGCGYDALENYEIFRVYENGRENGGDNIVKAVQMMESGAYDYVFIDMPGSLDQDGTGDMFEYIQHLIIPVEVSNYDRKSAEDFLEKLTYSGLRDELKTLKFVFNKYYPQKKQRFDEVEQWIVGMTGIPFLQTRVKHSAIFGTRGYNTLIPVNYRMNLSTMRLQESNLSVNIGELTNELLHLIK